jgi:hypothetical protein
MLVAFLSGRVMAQTSENVGGVGIALRPYQGWPVIEQVLPGSAAAANGLQPGDVLVAIDGQSVTAVPFESLPNLIRGRIGSTVVLSISRNGSQPQNVTLTRTAMSGAPAAPNQSTVQPMPAPAAHASPLPRPNAVPGTPALSGTIKLLRQSIRDPAANNLEALVFPLPEGWRAEGQVVWLHDHSVLTNIRARMTDPKTGTTIEYLPYENFIWFPPMFSIQPGQNYQGKIYLQPITDPAQFVQAFWVPQALPQLRGLQPVRFQSLPALSAEFLRLFAGPGEAQAYKLRYEYEVHGQPWEEDVQLGLLFSGNQQLVSWFVNYAVAVRAPKGLLDRMAPLTSAVIGNADSSPEWAAYRQIVLRHFYQGQMQQMRDTAAFGQKLAQYNAEMDQIRRQVVEDRMASQDRIAGIRREILGGVETYQDPHQNFPVELPAGYKDYWVNDRGEYLLSEQSGFDPNAGDTDNWKRMDRRVPGGR